MFLSKRYIVLKKWGIRLKEIRLKNELSQKEIGKFIDKDVTQVSRYERGGGASKMPKSFREELLGVFSKDEIEYIEHGEKESGTGSVNDIAMIYGESGFVHIPYHKEIYAAAGGEGSSISDAPSAPLSFSKTFLNNFLGIYSLNGLSIINAAGDSMVPTIKSGELMFVNEMGNESFKDGGIYVIMCRDALLVKRVWVDPVSGEYTLSSDNKNVDDIKLSMDEAADCRFVGRVVGHFDRV